MKYYKGLCYGACMTFTMLMCACGASNQKVASIDASEAELIQTDIIASETETESGIEEPIKEETDYIIVDRIGYRQFSTKRIYILANKIDDKFEVVEEDTGKTVFTGSLKKVADKQYDGKELYVGDLSDYKMKGNYRIYQANLGYSHVFGISDSRYKDEFREIYRVLEKTEFEKIEDELYVLNNLLMTRDIYTDTYIDSDYIENKIEDIVAMLESEPTKHITTEAEEATDTSEDKAQFDDAINAQIAGLLAEYAVLYGENNEELTNKCLSLAVSTFDKIDKTLIASDLYYYAASELYRATGQAIYKSAIEYFDSLGDKKTYSEYNYLFTADLAYLNTAYKTDYERSKSIMKNYREAAEAISGKIDKNYFYVQKDMDKLSDKQILTNMQKLGLVSYVLSGHESSVIIENYMHYLDGLNIKSEFTLTDSKEIPEKINSEDAIDVSRILFALGHLYNS